MTKKSFRPLFSARVCWDGGRAERRANARRPHPLPMPDSAGRSLHAGTCGRPGLAGGLRRAERELSEANRAWIAQRCDVVALPAVCLTTDTFPKIAREQPLFTPLLLAFASTVSEKPNVWGDVGGWEARMSEWTLRDRSGKEIPPPQENSHWMDFSNPDWAARWRAQIAAQTKAFGATGVVVSELPVANTAVGDNLAKYRTFTDRADATSDWLRAVHDGSSFLVIPSALGFDHVAGHPTLPTPPGTERSNLNGSLWDENYTASDGAWGRRVSASPTGRMTFPPKKIREMRLEAADRAGVYGQTYIAAGAYRNDAELEFLLASYLLVAHRQGRLVFSRCRYCLFMTATTPDAVSPCSSSKFFPVAPISTSRLALPRGIGAWLWDSIRESGGATTPTARFSSTQK